MKVKARQIVVGLLLLILSLIILLLSYRQFYENEYPRLYSEYVEKYSKEYDVDENLVYSIMRTESSFNNNSVSSVGAKGLMQMTDETYFWVIDKMKTKKPKNVEDLFLEENNIKHGIYLIKLLTDEYEHTNNVLAAYHAGWGSAQKWLSDPEFSQDGEFIDNIPFEDTNGYVEKVTKTYNIYNKLYGG